MIGDALWVVDEDACWWVMMMLSDYDVVC